VTPRSLVWIAQATGGRLVGADRVVDAIATDTRALPGGDALFIALSGDRFDGHDHVRAAIDGGCVAALVARELDVDAPQVVVADTALALAAFAGAVQRARHPRAGDHRQQRQDLGEDAAAVDPADRPGAYANPGNRNNEIGLPLAVLDAPDDARFAVYEMGAGKPGDIAYLTAIARPDVSLVNNIAPAHLERMGSLQGVAETKGAIYDALPADGVAVVNADDASPRISSGGCTTAGCCASASTRMPTYGHATSATRRRVRASCWSRRKATPKCCCRCRAATTCAMRWRRRRWRSRSAPASGAGARGPGSGAAGRRSPGRACVAQRRGAGRRQLQRQPRLAGRRHRHAGKQRRRGMAGAGRHARTRRRGSRAARAGRRAREGRRHRPTVRAGRLERACHAGVRRGAQAFDTHEALADAVAAGLRPGVRVLVKGSRGSAMDRIVKALLQRDAAENGGETTDAA
jgi:UDP-N-acetylmuramoyl-tripeptide--D-alanyl-D-alanine ligase